MMYTCAPAGGAAAYSSHRKTVKRGNKTLAVDLHCHVHVPEAAAIAKQTAIPERDPLEQHGSQRTADRQKWQNEHIHEKPTSTEVRLTRSCLRSLARTSLRRQKSSMYCCWPSSSTVKPSSTARSSVRSTRPHISCGGAVPLV